MCGRVGGRALPAIGLSTILARLLKREDFFLRGGWKLDENELISIEQVILPALVDNPHQIVFRSFGIRKHWVDLTQDQRRFVTGVLNTDGKLLDDSLHGQSR